MTVSGRSGLFEPRAPQSFRTRLLLGDIRRRPFKMLTDEDDGGRHGAVRTASFITRSSSCRSRNTRLSPGLCVARASCSIKFRCRFRAAVIRSMTTVFPARLSISISTTTVCPSTSADQGAYNLPCRRTGGEFLSRSDMPLSLSTHHPLGFFRSVRDNRGTWILGYGNPSDYGC
jgi:hypothetical protein